MEDKTSPEQRHQQLQALSARLGSRAALIVNMAGMLQEYANLVAQYQVLTNDLIRALRPPPGFIHPNDGQPPPPPPEGPPLAVEIEGAKPSLYRKS